MKRFLLLPVSFFGVLAAAVFAGTSVANAAVWSGPIIGIPTPSFGITQQAPSLPNPWISSVAGFYYVNASASNCLDSNSNGFPTRPRCTMPGSGYGYSDSIASNPLPAGAVVQIAGTLNQGLQAPLNGTLSKPIFIQGVGTSPTVTREWSLKGTYTVIENIRFVSSAASGYGGTFAIIGPSNFIVLRNNDISGYPNQMGAAIGIGSYDGSSVSNIVIYNNNIHDHGNLTCPDDCDMHGIGAGNGNNIWIVGNTFTRNSGDGIQLNGSVTALHHVYIGRNTASANRQSGIGIKNAADVIISENVIFGHRTGSGGDGGGMNNQYDPRRIWYLFNESYDNQHGYTTGDTDGNRQDIYLIGNVLRNNLATGIQVNGGVAAGSEYVIANNTIHNNPIGIENGYRTFNGKLINNLISQTSGSHIAFLEYNSGGASDIQNTFFEGTARITWDQNGSGTLVRTIAQMQALGECAGCLQGSPSYVNAAGNNFRLQANSSARDSGVVSAAYARFQSLYGISIAKDRDGNSRPNGVWDMGAYEFGGTASPPPTPNPTPSPSSTPVPSPTPTPGVDTQSPRVMSFDVQPRTLKVGTSVTASFTVTDTGGSHLSRVDLHRALYSAVNCRAENTSGCVWVNARSVTAPAAADTWTGTITEAPPGGQWWYGMAVRDNTGRVGYEPRVVQVLVNPASTPTPTPIPTHTTLPDLKPTLNFNLHEGDVVAASDSGDPDVFIVNEWGYKRLFLNPAIFNFYGHLGFHSVHPLVPTVRDAFPTSGLFRNCEAGDPNVYAVEVTSEDSGTLHHVQLSGDAATSQDPSFFHRVFCINTNEFNWYPKSPVPYTSLNQVPSYRR